MEHIIEKVRKKLEEKREYVSQLDIDVVTLRFGLDDGIIRTMEETAQILDLTRERVRISENRIIRSMAQAKRRKPIRDYYAPA